MSIVKDQRVQKSCQSTGLKNEISPIVQFLRCKKLMCDAPEITLKKHRKKNYIILLQLIKLTLCSSQSSKLKFATFPANRHDHYK